MRMSSASYLIEIEQVYFPKKTEWLEDFLEELLAFPNGQHDDQVDSVSQFLNWMDPKNKRTIHMAKLTGL